jgi:hypothetical protein
MSKEVCSAAEQTESWVWGTVASGDKVEGNGAKPPGNFEIFGLVISSKSLFQSYYCYLIQ